MSLFVKPIDDDPKAGSRNLSKAASRTYTLGAQTRTRISAESVAYELVRYETQLIENPEISGVEVERRLYGLGGNSKHRSSF